MPIKSSPNSVPPSPPKVLPPRPPGARARLMPIDDLIGESWQWFSAHAGKLVGLMAITALAQVVLAGIFLVGLVIGLAKYRADEISLAVAIAIILGALFFIIIFVIVSLWNTVAIYKYIIRDDPKLGVWATYRESWKLIFGYFGTSLLVGLIALGGFLLLIVPGVYWGTIYSFAPLIILAEGKKIPALARSKLLVKGHWLDVFGRQLLFSLIAGTASYIISYFLITLTKILGALFTPISFFVILAQYIPTMLITPISFIFSYRLYRDLRRVRGEY